jgi:hypothetical protein
LPLIRDQATGAVQVEWKSLSDKEIKDRAIAFPEAREELARRFFANKLEQKAG